MKHRTEEEITALILQVVSNTSNGGTQTIIMYKAYLTFAQLKRFLACLLEKGLIQYREEDRVYTITDKGMHFLQVYNKLNQLQMSISNNNNNNNSTMLTTQKSNISNSQSSYHIYENQRTNISKCEKCEKMFTSFKEMKLHKVEYHSY
jgi:predicted transcriptional regulator